MKLGRSVVMVAVLATAGLASFVPVPQDSGAEQHKLNGCEVEIHEIPLEASEVPTIPIYFKETSSGSVVSVELSLYPPRPVSVAMGNYVADDARLVSLIPYVKNTATFSIDTSVEAASMVLTLVLSNGTETETFYSNVSGDGQTLLGMYDALSPVLVPTVENLLPVPGTSPAKQRKRVVVQFRGLESGMTLRDE